MAALWEIGLRLINYIDDIFVMVETKSLLNGHVSAVAYLLVNLGFVINHPKSEFTPTQEIGFLGYTGAEASRRKDQKIRAEAKVLQPSSVSGSVRL